MFPLDEKVKQKQKFSEELGWGVADYWRIIQVVEEYG